METIIRENASVIRVGTDLVLVTPTKDGRGVFVENAQSNIFIPAGDAGRAIISAINKALAVNAPAKTAPVAKRTRRSSEEVQAEREAKRIKWEATQAEWARKREAKGK